MNNIFKWFFFLVWTSVWNCVSEECFPSDKFVECFQVTLLCELHFASVNEDSFFQMTDSFCFMSVRFRAQCCLSRTTVFWKTCFQNCFCGSIFGAEVWFGNRQINAHYVAISHLRVIWFLVCTILLQFLCVCVKIFNWSFSCLQSNCVAGQFYILLHCIKMHNVIQYTLYCTHKCVYMYISFILFLDLVSGTLGEKVLFLSFSVEKVTSNLVLTRQKTSKRSQWHLPREKAAWNFAMWASKWPTDNLNKPFYVMCN